jgi:ribonuclease R
VSRRPFIKPEPDRAAIRSYLLDARAQGLDPAKNDIARAFGIVGGDKIWLKRLLREIEAENGELPLTSDEPRDENTPDQQALPPVIMAEMRRRDPDGELIAEPAEWDERRQGPSPAILVSIPRRLRDSETAPGIGDRALIRVEPIAENERDEGGPAWQGRVLKLFGKTASVIGVFRSSKDGGGRMHPIDKRAKGREVMIPPGQTANAQDGDLISVSLLTSHRLGLSEGKVRERLGSLNSERAVSLIAIHTHDIPHVFPRGVVAEAESMSQVSMSQPGMEGREDWRALPLATIDPADAKDHDDAVHAAHDPDAANPGGFIVTVAIADVAAYVRPRTPLDDEALKRGNSVYFPDRVVPMLPERLSNDLCSLKPMVDRPAMAVRMVLDATGHKKRHSFHRIMMRSHAKLAYGEAQDAFDGRPGESANSLPADTLETLLAAFGCAAKARDIRGPLDLDLPERKLVLDGMGRVTNVIVPERLAAHRLIEEFMILANVAAAETLEKAGLGFVYRTHGEPTAEKLRALSEILASIGQKLPKQGVLEPRQFNRILALLKGSEHETFVNEVVLRTQAQAEYTSDNIGHFGLNLRRYAHFTSPIRRYADLIVHRALITALKLGDDGLAEGTTAASLRETARNISIAERRAMAAERETTDRLIAGYLAEHVGASFDGRVAGVTRSGLFVKLNETGADGFIPAATLGSDYYAFDERAHAITGTRTGESWRLGDKVKVKLVEAAPFAGALRFEMISDGRTVAKDQRPRDAGARRGLTRPTGGKPFIRKGGKR